MIKMEKPTRRDKNISLISQILTDFIFWPTIPFAAILILGVLIFADSEIQSSCIIGILIGMLIHLGWGWTKAYKTGKTDLDRIVEHREEEEFR